MATPRLSRATTIDSGGAARPSHIGTSVFVAQQACAGRARAALLPALAGGLKEAVGGTEAEILFPHSFCIPLAGGLRSESAFLFPLKIVAARNVFGYCLDLPG